jgi:uncharacterized protein DUF4390
VQSARLLLVALCIFAAPLAAQDGGILLRIDVPPATTAAPVSAGPNIVAGNLLAVGDTRELLRNGFPARLHYRLELWREKGWFDDVESATDWDVFVKYEPATESYALVRRHGQVTENTNYATLTSAEAELSRPYNVKLVPDRRGASYYYVLSIDIEAMSVSDLDELQRWLRGEVKPAVHGKNNPVTAIKNGIGTLLTRVLGGEKQHYVRRSATFKAN